LGYFKITNTFSKKRPHQPGPAYPLVEIIFFGCHRVDSRGLFFTKKPWITCGESFCMALDAAGSLVVLSELGGKPLANRENELKIVPSKTSSENI